MSKIALISDVHANLPALKAVIKRLEKEKPDTWICLGDMVGYGPQPGECLELIMQKEMQCLLGNHDAGVIGKLSLKHFRNPNRRLIEKTAGLITGEQYEWLQQLPLIIENKEESWLAVHASPDNPEKWEYLESAFKVRNMLSEIHTKFCFAGHTHRPALVSDTLGLKELKEGHTYMINPGSVGQSRDGDARASCALIDTDTMRYQNFRVPYNVELVLELLEELDFTRNEAERLMLPR